MIDFEIQVNSERLATQYRDRLLFLLNQVEEASGSYLHALSLCGAHCVPDDMNQLLDAVSNYKTNQRG